MQFGANQAQLPSRSPRLSVELEVCAGKRNVIGREGGEILDELGAGDSFSNQLGDVPQLRRAWQFPEATLAAQSLSTWSVWTLCRAVAFTYGVVVLHDLVFLLVVGADMLGRLAMVALILRAHAISAGSTARDRRAAHGPGVDLQGMMRAIGRSTRRGTAQRIAAG